MKSIYNLCVITDENDMLDCGLYRNLKKCNYPVIRAAGLYNGKPWHPWVIVNITPWSVKDFCNRYKQEHYEYHIFSEECLNVTRDNYSYSISADDLRLVDDAIYNGAVREADRNKKLGFKMDTAEAILKWLYEEKHVGLTAYMTRLGIYKYELASATVVDGFMFSADFKTLYRCSENKSGEVTVPDGVEKIRMFAFWNCDKITSVVVSKDVRRVGACAFESCSLLKRVKFCNTESLETEFEHPSDCIFMGCEELEKVDYGINTTVFCDMFTDCVKLKVFHGSKVQSIKNTAFSGCKALETLDVSPQMKYRGDGYQYAFFGCNDKICERFPMLEPIEEDEMPF